MLDACVPHHAAVVPSSNLYITAVPCTDEGPEERTNAHSGGNRHRTFLEALKAKIGNKSLICFALVCVTNIFLEKINTKNTFHMSLYQNSLQITAKLEIISVITHVYAL